MGSLAVTTEVREGELPDALAENLNWLLSQANHVLATELTAAMEQIGLIPRAYCVLSAALEREQTQGEIAAMIGLDKTTMVATVDSLEKQGLVERRPSPTDRRARVIAVTDLGREKAAEARRISGSVQRDVLGSLPVGQSEALLDALAGLVCGRLAEPAECRHAVRRRE